MIEDFDLWLEAMAGLAFLSAIFITGILFLVMFWLALHLIRMK